MTGYTRVGPDSPSDWVTDDAYHAGRVKRYHTWAVHHQQTVGEHCWQVALVYEQIWGAPSAEVERWIRHHDTTELVVGDPPFPVKANSPALKAEYDRMEQGAQDRLGIVVMELNDRDRARVKVCDLLEMMRFGMMEREMGNLLAVPIVVRTAAAAMNLVKEKLAGDTQLVSSWVDAVWERHNKVLRQSGYGTGYDILRWRQALD